MGNPQAQWFANRGYATLQVNYRGSTSYGKSFLHKGDGEGGVGAMQHDLTDAVRWAVDQGAADPDNVCIYGGSYGGYACLAGLTFTPDLYKCGVDIVGPSNIKTLLDSIPSYWGPLRNDMLKKIGDVDADPAFNERISPLFHVDDIAAPLLIGQGGPDRLRDAEEGHPGGVRAVPRRGARLRAAGQQNRFQWTRGVIPGEAHGRAGRRVREARGVDGPVSPGRGGGNGRGGGAQVTTAGEPHPCENFRACT